MAGGGSRAHNAEAADRPPPTSPPHTLSFHSPGVPAGNELRHSRLRTSAACSAPSVDGRAESKENRRPPCESSDARGDSADAGDGTQDSSNSAAAPIEKSLREGEAGREEEKRGVVGAEAVPSRGASIEPRPADRRR